MRTATPDSRCRSKLHRPASAGVLVLIVSALAAPAFCQQPLAGQVAPAAPPERGVPVTLDGEVLLYIRQPMGALSPAERAESIERRLVRMAEDPFYSTDQMSVSEKGTAAEIYYRGTLVGVVSAAEAAELGPGSAVDVATRLVRTITQSIERYRERREPTAVRRAVVLAAVATLILAGLLVGLRWLDRRLRQLVARVQAAGRIAGAPGAVTKVVRVLDRTASLQLRALRFGRMALTVVLAVAYLLTIFDLFPLTRGYVISIAGYFVDPVRVIFVDIWNNIGNFIFIIVISVLARYLLKGLRLLLSEAAAGAITLPGVQPDWALLLYKTLRLVVLAATLVIVYPYIPGSDTEAFKGIGLFAGALFTLGASGMAGSIIGGLGLAFSGTFHVGDRVKIGDVTGDVLEATLLLTRIRSIKNEIVTMPNSAVMSGHIVNYSARARMEGLLLTTEITIGYDAPWRSVHALLVEAALRTRNIQAEPAPFVLQKSLNDFHVSYMLCAYTRDANAMVLTYGELHQNIQDLFNEGGVEILSPAYSNLRDGNTTTIPASYRPEGYQPGPFGVKIDTQGGSTASRPEAGNRADSTGGTAGSGPEPRA
jgi:small-conductance mechanosensitive channel